MEVKITNFQWWSIRNFLFFSVYVFFVFVVFCFIVLVHNILVIDTLTIDNGSENYKFPVIESIKEIFHCHPYSSSEKGSIKNAHRLLRRYIPKGKSIDKYVGQDLKPIADL